MGTNKLRFVHAIPSVSWQVVTKVLGGGGRNGGGGSAVNKMNYLILTNSHLKERRHNEHINNYGIFR